MFWNKRFWNTIRSIGIRLDRIPGYCRHHRMLVTIAVLFTALGSAYWGYLHHSLEATRSRLDQTEMLLARTESRNAAQERRIQRAEDRLIAAIATLQSQQAASDSSIDAKLQQALQGIYAESRQRLSQLSVQTVEARQNLEHLTRMRMNSLREEVFQNLIGEYDRLHEREAALIKNVATRMEALQDEGRVFQRVFSQARNAVVYIRTEFQMLFHPSEEIRDMSTFGTGFLVSPVGVGMTAQHVIYPWRFDREFKAYEEMGMAEIVPGSHRVTMWLTGSLVMDNGQEPPEILLHGSYQMHGNDGRIRILLAADLENKLEMVRSPYGMIPVKLPKQGKSDLVVFQLLDFSRQFDSLTIAAARPQVKALDEVMVIGYPLARLENGLAHPQPSRGRVRQVGRELLELDSPLHPGNSGGPILNNRGETIGLASAILDSPVYGLAIRAEDLRRAWEQVKNQIRTRQRQLKRMGCDPGPIDGIPGKQTLDARICEQQMLTAAIPAPGSP